MDFMNAIENEVKNEKTFTENGAIAYRTSGSDLLDFNFKISALRKASEDDIIQSFVKVFIEDKVLAIKFLFYVSDIREGLGERRIFRVCMSWLADNYPKYADAVISLIPEYSRWDNAIRLIENENVKYTVRELIAKQITDDITSIELNEGTSLIGKWMPSENTSSKETIALAKKVRKALHLSSKEYRKLLSHLRKYLRVVETSMSANEWSSINYEEVPSLANLRYANAFVKHDEKRRLEYLNSLSKGEAKINTSVAQPHDIVHKYFADDYYWSTKLKEEDPILENMWKSLKDITTNNTLVVRDGSGSMYTGLSGGCYAIDVATALAIYCSEHTTEAFKDKFITFSARPELVDMSSCESLKDKLELAYSYDDCSNTNIERTMRLILDTAIIHNMTQEDMPENILIISDMQFDGGSKYYSNHWDASLFDNISKEFEEHGYKIPRICFWNLCGYDSSTVPMQKNDLGLILCSGFSINNLKMFMSGDIDPLKILLSTVNSDRYAPIEEVLNKIN